MPKGIYKRKPLSEETKRKIGMARVGKHHSKETRYKISQSNKGKKIPEDVRKKMSSARIGKTLSQKTKTKMSIAHIGKVVSPETRTKISNGNIGKKHSLESKRKMSIAKKGKHASVATEIKKGDKNEKSIAWKGDKVGYWGVHNWVRREKGSPKKCSTCGKEGGREIHWANIDHTYKRVLTDYIALCAKCHQEFDVENNSYTGGRYKTLIKVNY